MPVSRRHFLTITTAAAALAACQTPAPAGPVAPAVPPPAPIDHGAALKALLDQAAIDILAAAPEFATSLAVSPAQAGGPFMNRLSDASVDGMTKRADLARTLVARLDAINVAALSPADKITHAVVRETAADGVAGAAFGYGSFGSGPVTPYVVTQLDGAYASIPDFLDSQHPIKSRSNADDYLARLSAFAGVLDQETARIEADAKAGVIPPDFVIDGALKQLKGVAAIEPKKLVLVASLARRMGEVAEIDAGARAALATRAEDIVRDAVAPAFARQIAALEALRPQAVHDAGVWRLPNGEAFYKTALKAWTTSASTPDEIHAQGLDLVARFNGEMDAILKSRGMTRGTVGERVRALSRTKKQLYPNTDKGRAQLLSDLNAQIAAVTARMGEQFNTLATTPVEVKRVPAYVEAGAPGGYYQPAALDGSCPGAYYINLRNTAEWPRFTLPTLTYHEATPGHHWQISIAQKAQGLPFIRQNLIWLSGYAEGWALYAEQLADEMGMYADDPLGRLGYLQSMMFRASRLVVDTGLHAKRWSREQAIKSMAEATGDQISSVTTEIERYAVWPGQACAYMVGREVINALRAEAKAALADRYDQKAFHDLLLENGAMPFTVMQAVVREWIAVKKTA
jgi:uncharacterized protein (DUF885 family)